MSVLCHYRAKYGVNGNVSLEELQYCKDTGPSPAGLAEIETICYSSIEWIWTHLFILTIHIL